jgi:hypothetical protein
LVSVPSLPPRCFYFCRLSKFITCSSLLGALLYTSRVSGLRTSALYWWIWNYLSKKKKITVLTFFCISHILARRNILYSRTAVKNSQTGKGEEECSAFAILFLLCHFILVFSIFCFLFLFSVIFFFLSVSSLIFSL